MDREKLLQSGDIVFVRDWTPVSWYIRKQQGDFSYSHVCVAGENGFCIYSTGASKLLWFGRIDDIERYFRGKKIAIGRYQGLTEEQKGLIFDWCHRQIGKNRYPLFKLLGLIVKGFAGRLYRGDKEDDEKTINTYCAESVSLAFAAAGIILNPKYRLEADAQTPETIYNDPKVEIVYEE